MQKILLIDDDASLTSLISQFLSSNGYLVNVLNDAMAAHQTIDSFKPDLIILDLMMPGIDGLTLCREIRPNFHGVIMMLTALGDDIDEVTGLELGADDYLCKPVKPRLLLAHIRAQLRKSSLSEGIINSSGLLIDTRKRIVSINGSQVELTTAEFDLLAILANHKGQVISREDLHLKIFRLEYDGIDRSIDLRISRIRKKLAAVAPDNQLIKTVRNTGYILCD
ncbi:response regulator transcription factor [Pseudoalteromonas sp.]|uniref:response regulator transcription factor n=1 Tax=Pseudoalteromonas sp. TaxID=53249 RepID=UPI0035637824